MNDRSIMKSEQKEAVRAKIDCLMSVPIESYSFRPARAEDLPHLPEIEHAAAQLFRHTKYSELADDSPPDVALFQSWLQDGAIWVAVDSQENVVGFAVAGEVDRQGFLIELDVHPAHGRRGLGRRLIKPVRAWGREQGYEALRLSTFADVDWNAPYYARLGFRALTEDELSPGLLKIRGQEAASGLDVVRRVFMTLPIHGLGNQNGT
jgi:GNAT superfamily N-acetyltransferase